MNRIPAVARIAHVVLIVLATSMLTMSAFAASRSMTGYVTVDNPSAGVEGGPGVFARKVGGAGPIVYPPTNGARSISVAGTTTGTFVGRQLTLPASELNFSGVRVRKFPAFSNVAGGTVSWMSVQPAATFAESGGALANCPGPGCTSSGAGTVISWCPPVTHDPIAPAPGTIGAQVGNWDCPSWPAAAGGGDRFMRMGISNASGRANFGGTFLLLRNLVQNSWRVPVQPSTPNASDAEVTRTFMVVNSQAWTPGRSNFQFTALAGNNGPRLFARLDASGFIQSTFGCTNGVGTNGGNFMEGVPIPNAGSNCGTDPAPMLDGQGWGFKMTTGTISGSDPYPFGLVVTTVGGTPFNPNFGTQPASQGFFFSRMGTDNVTGTGPGANRNIVLLGGGVAVDPASGNAFFRISDLRMTLSVPEPATGLGLLAGLGALVGLARRRKA